MVTSLIEMLELPNFGHMVTTSTIKFELREDYVGDIMGKSFDVIAFVSKCLYFKKA